MPKGDAEAIFAAAVRDSEDAAWRVASDIHALLVAAGMSPAEAHKRTTSILAYQAGVMVAMSTHSRNVFELRLLDTEYTVERAAQRKFGERTGSSGHRPRWRKP